MVEEVKAGHRGRLILKIITNFQPCFCSTVCIFTDFFESLLVKLLACDMFHLLNCIVKLTTDICNISIIDMGRIVVRHIDHNQRNVVHTSDIFIPLCHAVADIIAAQNEVRLRHLTGYVGGFYASRICEANTGISADIGIIAHIFGSLTKTLSVMLSSNTSGLIFRIYNCQIQCFCNFTGKLGRRPAYRTACFLCFPCCCINIRNYLTQSSYTGCWRFLRFFSRRCRLCSGCCFFDFSHSKNSLLQIKI